MLCKTQPWRHQLQALRFLGDHPNALLHMGMGTGKTKVAIDFIQNMEARRPLILIVCPLAVCKVWLTEIDKHAARPFRVIAPTTSKKKVSVPVRTRRVRDFIAESKEGRDNAPIVVILNYECCIFEPMMSFLLEQKWHVVIADECHRLKTPTGKTSKFFAALRHNVPIRIGLSGTPLPHNPLDIFGQFRFLNSDIFGLSWFRFKMYYGHWGGFQNRQLLSIRNDEEFAQRMSRITFQARSEDVLDLPPFHHIDRTFEMSAKGRKFYETLEKDFVAWATTPDSQVTAAHALTRLLRLQQATSGHTIDDEGESHLVDTGKHELLMEVLDELPPLEPVVVFCRFKNDLESVIEACNKLERRCAQLRGGTNELLSWQQGKADILACQIQTGREGVDFTRAKYAIYYSLGFSLLDFEQSLKRLHRPGQAYPVTYVHLLAENSVDQKVYKALHERRNAVEAILEEVAIARSAV